MSSNDDELVTQARNSSLVTKQSRLVNAARRNDVNEMKTLLDSAELYGTVDACGDSLLQVAIQNRSFDVFDFIMSLEGYPLEMPDRVSGATPLETALLLRLGRELSRDGYFASQLIKKGANIHVISHDETKGTLLHCAIQRNYMNVVRLLVERGADIDKQDDWGCSPLKMFCDCEHLAPQDVVEGVSMLLYYGADPTNCYPSEYTILEEFLKSEDDILVAQENLFYYTVDQYSDYKIGIDVLFEVMLKESPLTYQILDNITGIHFLDNYLDIEMRLFSIKCEYLKIMIERFNDDVSQLLLSYPYNGHLVFSISIENFQILMESNLRFDTIELIGNLRMHNVIDLISRGKESPNNVIELIYYLLTYGINVYDQDVELVYRTFGYCELFKILLHMDIKKSGNKMLDIMPSLIYDVTVSIDKFLRNPRNYTPKVLEDMLDHFALPRLKEFCCSRNIKRITTKVKRLPQVPLLVELARNACREFIIEKYNITSTKQLCAVLKWLPIGEAHEKLILFETKLYGL